MQSSEALAAIKDAIFRGRYFIDPHAGTRMKQRQVSFHDLRSAVRNATGIEPYTERTPPAGTTSWRVLGKDFDGCDLVVGVDLTQDHLGNYAAVITVF